MWERSQGGGFNYNWTTLATKIETKSQDGYMGAP